VIDGMGLRGRWVPGVDAMWTWAGGGGSLSGVESVRDAREQLGTHMQRSMYSMESEEFDTLDGMKIKIAMTYLLTVP